jgi:hypothetical protein
MPAEPESRQRCHGLPPWRGGAFEDPLSPPELRGTAPLDPLPPPELRGTAPLVPLSLLELLELLEEP